MRSKSVENFLLSKGVDRSTLITRFSGESSPVARNDSEFGRSRNRRVELSIRFHLKNNNQVTAMEDAYSDALRAINISRDSDYNYGPDTYKSKQTVIIQSDDGVIVKEEVEEIVITEENLNSTIENIDYNEEELVEEELVEEELVEEELVEEVKPEAVYVNDNNGKYILVVQVFSSKENALKYIKSSSESLNYRKGGSRYYVYAYSSSNRDDVVRFRGSYKSDSWIKGF